MFIARFVVSSLSGCSMGDVTIDVHRAHVERAQLVAASCGVLRYARLGGPCVGARW